MTIPTPDYLNLIDRMNRQSCQLKALLTVAMSEHFCTELADNLRIDYLWACSDLAEAIESDIRAVETLRVQS